MKKIIQTAALVAMATAPVLADSARDRADIIVPEGWQRVYDEWHFSPAVKIDGKVYLSGVVAGPRDGDEAEGYRRAWQRISEILHASGATLDDIVEITSFHTALQAQLPVFSAVKDEFIKEPYPAWTAIGITELATPRGTVEIKVVAHVADVTPLK